MWPSGLRCEFESRQGKTKNMSVQKSNSSTPGFNFRHKYIYNVAFYAIVKNINFGFIRFVQ